MVSDMADSFSTCLAFTLSVEGGWADNPLDPGGCTMQGLTLPTFRQWKRNDRLSCADLHAVTAEDVHEFYYDQFWLKTEALSLPLGVDLMVFDAAVNMGISGSIKLLQRQVNVVADGDIGTLTLAAVLLLEPSTLVSVLSTAQISFYEALSDFDVFGNGWLNRVNARCAAATSMMSIA